MTEVIALFNERLNEALEKRDMRPVDLANRTDIPEATISQYRSGYAKPKYPRIVKIADALNVNLTWLMGGDVPMEKESRMPEIKHFNIDGVKYDLGNVSGSDSQAYVETINPAEYAQMKELFEKYQHAIPQIRDAVDSLLGSGKPES